MSKRFLIGAAAAVTTALAILLGGLLATEPSGGPSARSTPSALAEQVFTGSSSPNTATEIVRLAEEARRTDDASAYALLGLAYQLRARETADPANYSRSERALERALARDRANLYAIGGLGSLALSRHQFREALEFGRRAQQVSPATARTYGLIGDALVELGRYQEAFASFDRLARLKPGLAAYARVAYARELIGRPTAAEKAHRLAIEAAGPRPALRAAALAQLGELYISTGELVAAENEFRSALRVSPGFGAALEGLAHVRGSQGRYRQAILFATQAGQSGTETLGDLYLLTGRPRLAERQFAKAHEMARREALHGVRTDLELAAFYADHGTRLPHALALARRAHRLRPSIEADSILGWALTRSGRCQEALPYANRSLRLGTRNAEALFRRGMVDRCLGKHVSAGPWFRRAVSVSPYFSLLWGPVARRYAAAYDS
jgi:tetratricopeptide (TPR) repeat protein